MCFKNQCFVVLRTNVLLDVLPVTKCDETDKEWKTKEFLATPWPVRPTFVTRVPLQINLHGFENFGIIR